MYIAHSRLVHLLGSNLINFNFRTNGEIISEEFQPLCDHDMWRYLNVTDRQTDNLPWQYRPLRSIAR